MESKSQEILLTDERIKEFQIIYEKVFGEQISSEEASDKGRNLLLIYKVILKNSNSVDIQSNIDRLAS